MAYPYSMQPQGYPPQGQHPYPLYQQGYPTYQQTSTITEKAEDREMQAALLMSRATELHADIENFNPLHFDNEEARLERAKEIACAYEELSSDSQGFAYGFNATEPLTAQISEEIAKIESEYKDKNVYLYTFRLEDKVRMIAERAKVGCIAFYDVRFDNLTSVFGNFHPCTIHYNTDGYSERTYICSETVFQAQKFTDNRELFNLFDASVDGEKSAAWGQEWRRNSQTKFKMSDSRLKQWEDTSGSSPYVNKDDVMRYALHAKFAQNPELKALLIATGDAYLVEHTHRDKYWGDGGDGSGQNFLGRFLMEERGKLGGSASVYAPPSYYQMLQNKRA